MKEPQSQNKAWASATAGTRIRLAGLEIHLSSQKVNIDGQPLALTATEFRLLCILAGRPGWTFSRTQILAALHGEEPGALPRSVGVHIFSLRRKLGPYGRFIETVRGIGYRLRVSSVFAAQQRSL